MDRQSLRNHSAVHPHAGGDEVPHFIWMEMALSFTPTREGTGAFSAVS